MNKRRNACESSAQSHGSSGEARDPSLLDLSVTAGALAGPCLVACCSSTDHPTLEGRIEVAVDDGRGTEHRLWLPTLHGLAVREGDQVLVIQPRNWPEPIVAGVLDGLSPRPGRVRSTAAELQLRPDETLAVTDAVGTPLLEVFPTVDGPTVRLLDDRTNVELAGELRLTAKQISLAARQGEVTISASADVVVKGETIQLN